MSAWTIRPTTITDAEFVYDHIWQRGSIELASYGVSRTGFIVKCIGMLAAKCCVTFCRDDEPIAILGVEKNGAVAGVTWLQVTVEGHQDIAALTRRIRRAMPELAARAKVNTAYSFSLCVAPEAPRWYEFLGFAEDADYCGQSFAGHRERRFTRNFGGQNVRV